MSLKSSFHDPQAAELLAYSTTEQPRTAPLNLGRCMIIEDDDLDRAQYLREIGRSAVVSDLLVFGDAEHALVSLTGGAGRQADIIFLDLNLPRMSGSEFLAAAEAALGPLFTAKVIVMISTPIGENERARLTAFPNVLAFAKKPLVLSRLETSWAR